MSVVYKYQNTWYHYDENYVEILGPFESKELALKSWERFVEIELYGRDDPHPEIRELVESLDWKLRNDETVQIDESSKPWRLRDRVESLWTIFCRLVQR
jgi:hypothetical protein